MIIKYEDFLLENNNSGGITKEEKLLLKKFHIKNYVFNTETGLIDITDNFSSSKYNTFSKSKVNYLPFKIGVVYGVFNFYNNLLENLKSCPKKVTGYYQVGENRLTSLEGSPEKIDGFFSCGTNKLTSLEGGPLYVGGKFNCERNQLTSLDYCPKFVGGDFSCHINKLSSITDYPMCMIGGGISDILDFPKILEIVNRNPEVYKNLLDNKIKFHQQIMRDDLSMIPLYQDTDIPLPSKKTILMDI